MTIIVATNVIASRPPERWPTGMPHARANGAFVNAVHHFVQNFSLWDGIRDIAVMIILLSQNFRWKIILKHTYEKKSF